MPRRGFVRASVYAAAAGTCAGLSLGLFRSAEAQPVLPPQPEPLACQVTRHWLGKNVLRVTVSDPSLAPNERVTGVDVNWDDGSLDMVSPIDEVPSYTTRGPLAATHIYTKAGAYTIEATISGQSTTGEVTWEVSSLPDDQTCQLPITVSQVPSTGNNFEHVIHSGNSVSNNMSTVIQGNSIGLSG